MKIMQNDFYSEGKAWDTSDSNNWSRPATLNTELNGTYWNEVTTEYRAMVDGNYVWNIGGRVYSSLSNLRSEFYSAEKGKTWTGKVGLMNIADFGYASTSTNCTDSTDLYDPDNACMSNNWMFRPLDQWTITPSRSSVWGIDAAGALGDDLSANHESVV